jgi:hypothetical protein
MLKSTVNKYFWKINMFFCSETLSVMIVSNFLALEAKTKGMSLLEVLTAGSLELASSASSSLLNPGKFLRKQSIIVSILYM